MLRRLCLIPALAAALVACSDDGDGSSGTDDRRGSSYYQDLADLTGGLDDANTAADEDLNAAVPTADPAEIGNLFSAATLESADRLETALDAMAALEPPEDAAGAHDGLLTATRAELELSREFAASLAGLDQADLEVLRTPPEQAVVEGRTDDACEALQALADGAGADVELCVGMFAPPA